MDELRPDALAAEVAAWHNRHPLARRITPAQVQGIGWVALPFVQRPGASPLAAPDGAVPVLVHSIDDPRAGGASGAEVAGSRLRDRAQARAQGPAAGAEAPAGAPPAAVGWRGLPQRLLAAARHGLHLALASPARWAAALQAARQQHAQLRLRTRSLKAAFSEDFIAPLSPRQVARWALRHGQLQARGSRLPMREVRPDARWGRQDTGLVTLYLATAAIEVGSRRARVLLPAGGGLGRTLGPRLMSPQRTAAALGVLAVLGLGIARPEVPPPGTWPGVATAQATLARWQALASGNTASGSAGSGDSVESAATAASAAADFDDPASAAWAAADAALAADAAQAAQAAEAVEALPAWAEASTPPDLPSPATSPLPPVDIDRERDALAMAGPDPLRGADPDGGASTLPPDDPPPPPPEQPFRPGQRLVRPLDEATKTAARQTVAALRAARGDAPAGAGAAAAAAGPLAMSPMPPTASPAVADPGAALGPAFALTTRPLRTRAESEQVQTAVRALLAQITTEPLLVELMPAGDDWRVVCWPFSRREDAQLARALLLTRGLRLEAVEF